MFSVDLQYQIVDHCNLNCAGCDHCAPLAEPWYVDVQTFEHDLKTIANVITVSEVDLYGGEPLLHPELLQLLAVVRRVCPNAILSVKTNGLLLRQMLSSPLFRNIVKASHMMFRITEYPASANIVKNLSIDFPGLVRHATRVPGEVDVSCPKFTMYRMRLHKPGKQWRTADDQRKHCFCLPYETPCVRVRAGFVYPCPVAMCAPLFLRKWLSGLPDVGVSVEKLNKSVVDDICKKSCEMCAWCANPVFGVPWQKSSLNKNEWIDGV